MTSQVAALALWTAASTGLQLANRVLLGTLAFPGLGLVAVAQNVVTLLVCLSQWRALVWPPVLRPLVVLGLCTGVSQLLGLAASGFLALSMFGVLRRTSLLVALAVGLWHGERHGRGTQVAVVGMTAGAVVASLSDVSFHAAGYAAVLLDNVFTVLQRQALAGSPELPWATLLLCQALFSLPLLLLFCALAQSAETVAALDALAAAGPGSPLAVGFALSAALGVVLSLCVMRAIARVSPLSLSVAGAAKNNVLALASLASGPPTNLRNVAGILLSAAANALYVWTKS